VPFIVRLQGYVEHLALPSYLIVGLMALAGFLVGKNTKRVKLPTIIGYMAVGALLGPSFLGLLNEHVQGQLDFITELALGFVAISIGLELSFPSLRRLGRGILYAIFAESFGAFLVVLLGVYLLTRDLPLALVFAAVAPASAPAGTVAVIQEYRARGNLTKALYAVVGFDDGLGIIIFGFTAALARALLRGGNAAGGGGLLHGLLGPCKEIALSLAIGAAAGLGLCALIRKYGDARSAFIFIFAAIVSMIGLSKRLHLSPILTNMVLGLTIVNSQTREVTERIRERLTDVMPLLFVLFFTLAGAHLEISLLPSLGVLGAVYVICRSAGLVSGAWVGASIGGMEGKVRKYLGLGILSQAGVAIGLSLVVYEEFAELGAAGQVIGKTVLATVTATCVFFEIVGPLLTKIALERAGEVNAREEPTGRQPRPAHEQGKAL